MSTRWPTSLTPVACAFGRTRNPAVQVGSSAPFYYAPQRPGGYPLWTSECTFELTKDGATEFRSILEKMDGQNVHYVMGDWANPLPAMHPSIKTAATFKWDCPDGSTTTWIYGDTAAPATGASTLAGAESSALAISFVDSPYAATTGHHGSAYVISGGASSTAATMLGSETGLAVSFIDTSFSGLTGHYGSAYVATPAAVVTPVWSTGTVNYDSFVAALAISTAAGAGAMSVLVSGFPASSICMSRGDLCEIDGSLYMLNQHALSDGSGIAQLTFNTPLKTDAATDSEIRIIAPGCYMRLDSVEWSEGRSWNEPFAMATCRFIEVLEPHQRLYLNEDGLGFFILEDDSGYLALE